MQTITRASPDLQKQPAMNINSLIEWEKRLGVQLPSKAMGTVMASPHTNSLSSEALHSLYLQGVSSVDLEEFGPELRVSITLSQFDRETRDRISRAKTAIYRSHPGQKFDFIVIDGSQSGSPYTR